MGLSDHISDFQAEEGFQMFYEMCHHGSVSKMGHHIQQTNSYQRPLGFRTSICVNSVQYPAPQNPLALKQHSLTSPGEDETLQGARSSLSGGGSTQWPWLAGLGVSRECRDCSSKGLAFNGKWLQRPGCTQQSGA